MWTQAPFFLQRVITLRGPSQRLEVTSIHLKAKQISQTFLFLRSASENGRPALLKIEMVDPGGVERE